MIEYEKKLMLTADEYKNLRIIMCKYMPTTTHTNYYFDSDDLYMNNHGITCRVRGREGLYATTLKKHCSTECDYSIETDIAVKSYFDPKTFDVLGLHFQGLLVTERTVLYKGPDFKVVIDSNSYLGTNDFELEIEYQKGCEKSATQMLEKIADALVAADSTTKKDEFLERVGKSKSKSQRFFERKIERDDNYGRGF